MREITSATDFTAATSTGSVLVDFWAPWCGPCKALAPTLEAIEAANPGTSVVKVNVETPEGCTISAKFGIASLPTVILFRDGKKAGQLVGNVSAQKIRGLLG